MVHKVAIPIAEESSAATTPSGDHPFLSSSSNQSVLIARTRTQSVIDRSSPYNVIETSTDVEDGIDDDDDDDTYMKSINDEEDDEVMITEPVQTEDAKYAETTLSPSSSLTSGTDVYMDAVDILSDERQNDKSGRRSTRLYGTLCW